jgi:hypothetical protein
VLRIFIALKKSIALVGFEPATFGSSGKHTNYYTTKAIRGKVVRSVFMTAVIVVMIPRVQMSYLLRFQVLMAANMKFRVFWDVAPCSYVKVDRIFRCAYCLHNQGDDDGGTTHL